MNSKVKIILSLIIISLVAYIIGSTYSKYVAKGNDELDLHISAWNIKVNNQSIREHQDFTEYVDIEYDSSEYIMENVIAPSKKGHFNVVIDYTGTELPFEYNIETDLSEAINVPDFRITGYKKITDATITDLPVNNQLITGTITEDELTGTGPKNIAFTVYIEWYDEPDNILNNFNDVVSKTFTEAKLPIKFSVTELLPGSTSPTPDPDPDPNPDPDPGP